MKLKEIRSNELGLGRQAKIQSIIDEFSKSKEDGVYYCESRGWDVSFLNGGHVYVQSRIPFGFSADFKSEEELYGGYNSIKHLIK